MASECSRCGRPKAAKREFVAGACLYDTGDELDAMICDIAAAAFIRGAEWAVEMAQSKAEISTWDGWHEHSPRIDWDRVNAELERRKS